MEEGQHGSCPYAGKHHESVYTRFFQTYIPPRKFAFDKQRLHLSTLIMAGQARRGAMAELEQPICPAELLGEDKAFVVKKLAMTEAEFDAIMGLPPCSLLAYPTYEKSLLMRWYRRSQSAPDAA
jgi:hypothetical protein